MKKVRVVSLASDMPTGPPLSPNRFDSLDSMELEIDSSMLSQTRKK